LGKLFIINHFWRKNGATSGEIAEVLGHKTLAMVKRYAHLSESHTKGVVTMMNDAIFGKTG
jgi:integrase